MRKLGLDVGSKSCGIAISDALNITAQGIENYIFNEYDFETLTKHIINILMEYDIDVIVVGRPTLPSGDSSNTTIMIEKFVQTLKKDISQQVIFIDENMTTKKANQIMIKSGLSRKKRKLYKDKIAAQLILSDYLETI